jgi:hypothetical protein
MGEIEYFSTLTVQGLKKLSLQYILGDVWINEVLITTSVEGSLVGFQDLPLHLPV